MSKRKKLNVLFSYLCRKCTYMHKTVNPYVTTFSTSTALSMLQTGRGNCYCYASAFAYLVKAATGYETRVSYGVCTIRRGWGRGTYSHGWTEVKIGGQWKIFDVELYDRGSYSSRYSSGKTYSQMNYAGTSYKRYGYVNITL
jgi:transglutaminase-like putative cysteine protease